MSKLLLTIIALAVSASAFGQQAFSSLEEQMTGAEFKASGLEKLTPGELATLNNWVRAHSLATLDTPETGTSDTGGEGQQIADMDDDTPITSKLVGKFSGWDGQTTFKLENGMIWQQVDKDKFYIKEIDSPLVTIEPGTFGSKWKLTVEGYEEKCKVERIQ